MRGRGDGDDPADVCGHALGLGHVEGLEGAFGVADDVDGRCPSIGQYLVDEGSDLACGLGDRPDPADIGEAWIGAVGQGERAVALLRELALQDVEILVGVGAESVEDHDRRRMGDARPTGGVVHAALGRLGVRRDQNRRHENSGRDHGRDGEQPTVRTPQDIPHGLHRTRTGGSASAVLRPMRFYDRCGSTTDGLTGRGPRRRGRPRRGWTRPACAAGWRRGRSPSSC